jgi:PPM family protein phosphatase
MRIRPGTDVAGLTDVGCQRENNEDRLLYWEPSSDDEFALKGRLALVADGMGGHEGGQEASRIAAEAIQETYSASVNSGPQAALAEGFRQAHRRIQEEAARDPELHGMGTTATAIALVGHDLYFAHLGDSRLYLIRGTEISRLTHDHSYVSRMVENGLISAEEAEIHPQRNILTAALGVGPEVLPDVPAQTLSVQKNDVLVLCTDGLWGVVHDGEIRAAVDQKSATDACHDLVQVARARGGPDNITVQVIRIL